MHALNSYQFLLIFEDISGVCLWCSYVGIVFADTTVRNMLLNLVMRLLGNTSHGFNILRKYARIYQY
jgi:hypothetical protein